MSNIRQLSKELQQKAINELNEDVSRIPQDIQAIKDWLKQKNYLNAKNDDQTILNFLRVCKFSLERTKEKMETFYTYRTMLPEIFQNRDPFRPEIQEILKTGQFLIAINQKDPTAPRLLINRTAGYDPAKIKKDDLVKVQVMIGDILTNEDDQTIIGGMLFLVDCKDVTMAHIYSPALLVKLAKYLQGAAPCRLKGFHVFHLSPIFASIYNFAVSLLSEKLKSRVHLHGKTYTEEMCKTNPKDELPKEYGGDGPSIQELTEFWKQKVESYAEWFKEDEKYRSNEKLRPGKPKTSSELFGVEGAFRKLDVD